jgi:hypothetical protein
MTGRGNFAGVFADSRAARLVDRCNQSAIGGLLNSPHDGAAHAPADPANDDA